MRLLVVLQQSKYVAGPGRVLLDGALVFIGICLVIGAVLVFIITVGG